MKHSPSYRDELPEPLRSVIEDLANVPVPEELLKRAKQFSVPVSKPKSPPRSGLALVVSVFAMSLCIAALLVQEKSPERVIQVVKEEQPIPPRPTEEIPPPTLWAYRQAHSADALEELLNQHADMLLPPESPEDLRSFHLFSRKEDL